MLRHDAAGHHDVRNDPAAAEHGAARVRLELGTRLRAVGHRGLVVVQAGRRRCGRARTVDAAAVRRVPEGGGELHGSIADAEHALRAALPVGRRAHQQRAIVILERAGDDLARRRRSAVRQHHDRHVLPTLRRPVGERAVLVRRPPARRDDRLARVEEEVGDSDPLIEQAARIAAQIEHERPCTRGAKRVDRAREVGRGLGAEHREVGVADAVLQEDRVLDRVHLDVAPSERERQRRRHAGPLHDDAHARAGRAAQGLQRFFGRQSARRLAVDLDDAVAGGHARLLGRRAAERRDDRDAAVAHVHLDAHAGVVAARALVEAAQAPLVEKHRVRIVQLSQHARDGLAIQQRIRERVHEVAPHVRHHLVEQARARGRVERGVRRRLALDQPAARHQRAGQHCRRHYST